MLGNSFGFRNKNASLLEKNMFGLDVLCKQVSENRVAKSGENGEHLFDVSGKFGMGTPENTEKTTHLSAQCNLPWVI